MITDSSGCGSASKAAMSIVTIMCRASGWLVKLEDASEASCLSWWVPLAYSELRFGLVRGLGNFHECYSDPSQVATSTVLLCIEKFPF